MDFWPTWTLQAVIGLGISLLLIVAGGMARTLVTHKLDLLDFCLGVELSFSAIASVLVGLARTDGSRAVPVETASAVGAAAATAGPGIAPIAGFTTVSIVVLFFIMVLHAFLERAGTKPSHQIIGLAACGNLLGTLLLVTAVIYFGGE